MSGGDFGVLIAAFEFRTFFFGGTKVWNQDFGFSKQARCCLSHTSSPFCCDYFGDGSLENNLPDWPRTTILLPSAFQVARITGMNFELFLGVKIISRLIALTHSSYKC
jgi:hypothetical protein